MADNDRLHSAPNCCCGRFPPNRDFKWRWFQYKFTRRKPRVGINLFAMRKVDRSVKFLKLVFEINTGLGNDLSCNFYGLFWGEQQPFVSSGCGGLYFLQQ